MQFLLREFGHWQISEKVRTNGPLSRKYKLLKKNHFNPKTLQNIRNSLKISLSQDPWYSHNKQKNLPRAQCATTPNTPPPYPSPLRLILIIFLQKWVCNVVLQKCAVEISQVRSAILKKCAGGIFRSAHQYLRSGYWSFYLEGLSDKSEVCTDRYQRSVDFWELCPDLWKVHADNDIWEVHTGLSEVRTDVQKGRSGV